MRKICKDAKLSLEIISLEKIDPEDASNGGKATSLVHLIRIAIEVPEGFVIPARAYEDFMCSMRII